MTAKTKKVEKKCIQYGSFLQFCLRKITYVYKKFQHLSFCASRTVNENIKSTWIKSVYEYIVDRPYMKLTLFPPLRHQNSNPS